MSTTVVYPAQFWSVFAVWSPNTGSEYVGSLTDAPTTPKLDQTNPNNLPNFNVAPVQVHQKYTRKQAF